MYSFSVTKLIIVCALFLLFLSPVWAQPKSTVIIHRIAKTQGNNARQNIEGETPDVQYKRNNLRWQNAKPGLPLEVGDQIKVSPNMHVDVRIEGEQNIEMVLLPDGWNQSGNFGLQGKGGTWEIKINAGALSAKGKGLLVDEKGVKIKTTATKVSFLKDPDTNQRILFMEEGSVVFPGYENKSVPTGFIAVLDTAFSPENEQKMLQNGYIAVADSAPGPRKLQPTKAQAERLRKIIEYNTVTPWAKPFPWHYPVGAAAAAAVGYRIVTQINKKEESTLPPPPALP